MKEIRPEKEFGDAPNSRNSIKVFNNVYISLIDSNDYFIKTDNFEWIINKSIINSDLEESMKLADITPVNKNDNVTDKSNYRPISGLPSLSKLFEKVIQSKISTYIETTSQSAPQNLEHKMG